MVVDGVVHQVPRDQRRDDHRGHPHAEAAKVEVVVVVLRIRDRVTRRHRRWRRHVIVEAAVLVVGQDQQALIPVGRAANRLVDVFDQPLAPGNVVEWMLRVSAPEVTGVRQDVAIVRLDEDVARGKAALADVGAERVQSSEPALQKVERHASDLQHWGKLVAVIDRPRNAGAVEAVVDGSVVEANSFDQPLDVLQERRAVVEAARGRRVDEKPVRPGRAGHRRKPVIANRELAGQGSEHRHLFRCEALHDDRGIRRDPRAARDEAAVVDVGVRSSRSTELLSDGVELVRRIEANDKLGRWCGGDDLTAGVDIGAARVQSRDRGRLAGTRVLPGDAGGAEQVVKGAILQHQHENVFDGRSRRSLL